MGTDKDVDVGVLGEPHDHNPHHLNGALDDPETDGLSLYEKKAVLIDRELDSHGMGRYQVGFYSTLGEGRLVTMISQWSIFFLCGFGYLLDLLYAHAFGLVAPAIQQELGFSGILYTFSSQHCQLTRF